MLKVEIQFSIKTFRKIVSLGLRKESKQSLDKFLDPYLKCFHKYYINCKYSGFANFDLHTMEVNLCCCVRKMRPSVSTCLHTEIKLHGETLCCESKYNTTSKVLQISMLMATTLRRISPEFHETKQIYKVYRISQICHSWENYAEVVEKISSNILKIIILLDATSSTQPQVTCEVISLEIIIFRIINST